MEYKSFTRSTWEAFTEKCKALFPFLKKTFIGTQAEWDALSTAAKKEYDVANITDDTAGGELVVSDEVTVGDLNPVTSNAVAKAVAPVNERPTVVQATMVNQTTGSDVRCYPKSFKIQLYLGGGFDSNGKICSFTLPENMVFRVGGWGTAFMGMARNPDSGATTPIIIMLNIENNVGTLTVDSVPSGYTEIRALNVTLFSTFFN